MSRNRKLMWKALMLMWKRACCCAACGDNMVLNLVIYDVLFQCVFTFPYTITHITLYTIIHDNIYYVNTYVYIYVYTYTYTVYIYMYIHMNQPFFWFPPWFQRCVFSLSGIQVATSTTAQRTSLLQGGSGHFTPFCHLKMGEKWGTAVFFMGKWSFKPWTYGNGGNKLLKSKLGENLCCYWSIFQKMRTSWIFCPVHMFVIMQRRAIKLTLPETIGKLTEKIIT